MAVTITEDALSIDADKGLALTIAYLQKTIADSQWWRGIAANGSATWAELKTIVKAPNADLSQSTALSKIWMYDIQGEGESLEAPSCLIALDNSWMDQFFGPATYEVRGDLCITFAWPIPETYKNTRGIWYVDSLNKISAIHEDLTQVNQLGSGYLTPDRLTFARMGAVDSKRTNGQSLFLAELLFSIRGKLS